MDVLRTGCQVLLQLGLVTEYRQQDFLYLILREMRSGRVQNGGCEGLSRCDICEESLGGGVSFLCIQDPECNQLEPRHHRFTSFGVKQCEESRDILQ